MPTVFMNPPAPVGATIIAQCSHTHSAVERDGLDLGTPKKFWKKAQASSTPSPAGSSSGVAVDAAGVSTPLEPSLPWIGREHAGHDLVGRAR